MKCTLSSQLLPGSQGECSLIVRYSRLDNPAREKMRHLRCLCFVRPSSDSIQNLIEEFREPRYGEYYVCTVLFYLGLHQSSPCAPSFQQRGPQVVVGKTS